MKSRRTCTCGPACQYWCESDANLLSSIARLNLASPARSLRRVSRSRWRWDLWEREHARKEALVNSDPIKRSVRWRMLMRIVRIGMVSSAKRTIVEKSATTRRSQSEL